MSDTKDGSLLAAEVAKSTLDDAKQPLVLREEDPESGTGKPGSSIPRSSVFNWGERQDQDVLYGRVFLAGLAVLLLRELCVFFFPLLTLKLIDPATFTLEPFIAILLGLVITVPGCFALLWASKNTKAGMVHLCLVLCLGFFALSVVSMLALHHTPGAGTEETDEFGSKLTSAQGSTDLRNRPSHQAVGALGDESEATMLEAAIPGSISRILRVTSSIVAAEEHSHLLLPSSSPHPLRSFKTSPLHVTPAETVARRMLLVGRGHVERIRRMLRVSNLVQRDRLNMAQQVLGNLANAGGVFAILYFCQSLFPLTALIISDSAKFVLTRGRGLVFKVVAAVAFFVLTSLPVMSTALQIYGACQTDRGGLVDVVSHSNEQMCATWKATLPGEDPFSWGFFGLLGLFLTFWILAQFQVVFQYVAAHLVGQCYGNARASMDEDDLTPVLRAVKCAVGPSFGSLSLLSLVMVALLAASVLLNLFVMTLVGDSIIAAVPIVVNSFIFFGLSLFLSCFVLPLMAVTGQSFAEAWRSGMTLIERYTKEAVVFTVASLCVVGVLIFLIILAAFAVGFVAAVLISVLGSLPMVTHGLWLVMLVAVVVGTSAGALTLFHWVFSTTISTLFLCMAQEGKATETATTTPLGLQD